MKIIRSVITTDEDIAMIIFQKDGEISEIHIQDSRVVRGERTWVVLDHKKFQEAIEWAEKFFKDENKVS